MPSPWHFAQSPNADRSHEKLSAFLSNLAFAAPQGTAVRYGAAEVPWVIFFPVTLNKKN